jgi:hypothetical protein
VKQGQVQIVIDGPGECSLSGTPRHDNDHKSIRDIAIHPTAEEVTAFLHLFWVEPFVCHVIFPLGSSFSQLTVLAQKHSDFLTSNLSTRQGKSQNIRIKLESRMATVDCGVAGHSGGMA